ncbi:MAG: hypothetical protein A4E63_02259 [Syntrophorhabdus sp. PtaU1.Bin050]|nr:MAG: hypothetical protein A4E63_02259 [Syntrophorhabdus sp. PtaU1.Bin050]
MIRSDGLDSLFLKKGFVEASVCKPHRKGAHSVIERLFDQRADIGAVQTSAQIGAHRHIGAQPDAAGIMEKFFQFLCPFRNRFVVVLAILRKGELPVTAYFHFPFTEDRVMTGHELLYILESRSVVCRGPTGKDIRKSHRVKGPLGCRVGKYGFYLRGENKVIIPLCIKKWSDAHTVAGKKKGLPTTVPDCDSKLSVQIVKHPGTLFFIEMQKHFRIGICREPVTPHFQFRPQLHIIEDFAVINDPEGLIFVVNGLISARKVKDAEAC